MTKTKIETKERKVCIGCWKPKLKNSDYFKPAGRYLTRHCRKCLKLHEKNPMMTIKGYHYSIDRKPEEEIRSDTHEWTPEIKAIVGNRCPPWEYRNLTCGQCESNLRLKDATRRYVVCYCWGRIGKRKLRVVEEEFEALVDIEKAGLYRAKYNEED